MHGKMNPVHRNLLGCRLLLLLLVGLTLVLPSGLHLEFCLGGDGHFEISLDECTHGGGLPAGVEKKLNPVSSQHADCRDLVLACGPSRKIIVPEKPGQAVLVTRLSAFPEAIFGLPASSPNPDHLRARQLLSSQFALANHLLSHSSVVLLI